MTTHRSEPYTLREFAAQIERVDDRSQEPTPGVEDVFGDDSPAVLRAFAQRTGEPPEAAGYVFMGVILGVRMAEARRDG